MNNKNFRILLADDDPDDRMFFQDVLEEIHVQAQVKMVQNGVELMDFLQHNIHELPHVLFLDLNMPLKSGTECLLEIKVNEDLKHIPVIVYSTTANPDVIEQVYNLGAQYYVRKEGDFSSLKAVVGEALSLCQKDSNTQPMRTNFLILI